MSTSMTKSTTTVPQLIAMLRAQRVLSALDEQLARSLCLLAGESNEHVGLAIALLSRNVAAGHVCLPLHELANPEVLLGLGSVSVLGSSPTELSALELQQAWPALEPWIQALRASPLCDPNVPESPLVIDRAQRLYLRRHYDAELQLSRLLLARAAQLTAADEARVAARLQVHFAAHFEGTQPEDLQRTAAELATRRKLCVISGGPGTGKTSTVVKILATVIEEALASAPTIPRIALTAPTGKAAVRLQASVLKEKQKLRSDPQVIAAIPEVATTIHRLLAPSLYRDRSEVVVQQEPLPVDLLLVDEASMVDLELMTQLLAALPEHTRVILLGDRDQLASVEAGAVLGDICAVVQQPAGKPSLGQQPQSALAQCIVQLTRSYRYDAESGIGELARAVQAGDAARALAVLDNPSYPDVTLHEAEGPLIEPRGPFAQEVVAGYRPYLAAMSDPDPARALRAFDGFRVLCAHRQGARGVVSLNREIARLLERADLIEASEGQFLGRPLMITENDYRTQLWNGDIGIVRSDDRQETRAAYFVAADGDLRRLGIARLPPHESAFALSVHKSQGSEVDAVSLVLPSEASRILSRELIYTALTRARKTVSIHGTRDILRAAIGQAVSRNTGLQDLLR